MSKTKKKTQLSDDVACNLVSKAFSDIIHNSKNESFKKQCYEILQVKSNAEVKGKIHDRFQNFLTKKINTKAEIHGANRDAVNNVMADSLFEGFECSNINAIQELDGFENWEEYINANK